MINQDNISRIQQVILKIIQHIDENTKKISNFERFMFLLRNIIAKLVENGADADDFLDFILECFHNMQNDSEDFSICTIKMIYTVLNKSINATEDLKFDFLYWLLCKNDRLSERSFYIDSLIINIASSIAPALTKYDEIIAEVIAFTYFFIKQYPSSIIDDNLFKCICCIWVEFINNVDDDDENMYTISAILSIISNQLITSMHLDTFEVLSVVVQKYRDIYLDTITAILMRIINDEHADLRFKTRANLLVFIYNPDIVLELYPDFEEGTSMTRSIIDSFDSLKVSWITAFAAAYYDMMKNCSYSCFVNDSDTIDILCDSLAELIDINENEEDNIDLRQILENLIILTDDGD